MTDLNTRNVGRQVMFTRFVPGPKIEAEEKQSRLKLMNKLEIWKGGIPAPLRYDKCWDPGQTPLQALLVEVLYK